tara:strand:+ start:4819 stop:7134 length:2316 start_codon:yes stop_codon:yes gene_type:complete
MAFDVGGFNSPSKTNFNADFSKGFDDRNQFSKPDDWKVDNSNPYTAAKGYRVKFASEVKFYNQDGLWPRWRRGYEIYTMTQSILGSTANERSKRGDYRLYFTFQQYPGIFIPARIFTFPSTNQELGEHIVGMRDTDGFNFYDFGLPILDVRYLGNAVTATYSQSGTTIVVTKNEHGLYPGDNVYLDFSSGSGVDATLSIVSKTQNTFTLTAAAPATTSGNVTYYVSTAFTDPRWTVSRVKLRYLPTEVSFFAGERLADRIIEKDPGISSTYSRTASTVTVTCSAAHGLSSGNTVFLDVSTGDVSSGRYVVTVTGANSFTVTTITSGSTSGNVTLNRLLRGYRYDDYVGYTVTGSDATTNELIFQRDDSYGASTTDNVAKTTVPAHRGFAIGRYLTTELRWQCSCQDFSRRDSYDLFSELTHERFPVTNIHSTKPGNVLQPDGTLSDSRDIPGTFSDLGYLTINNFYQLPSYKDTKTKSFQNLMYYQLRWCKHIYAAMFSLVHDEGNEPLKLSAKYTQSGPNITVEFDNHGLDTNTKIDLTFTSGDAVSGEYTITSVPDVNSFVVIYPFSNISSGYCTVSNLKKHEYVGAWLNEPNDEPIGAGREVFEQRFAKEKAKLKESIEILKLFQRHTKWSGNKEVTGDFNLPQNVADFDPSMIGMTLTDGIKRDSEGNLSRSGATTNTTNRMIALVNKLFNKSPTLIEDIKFGLISQPLSQYVESFESGLVKGGEFFNGDPVETASSVSTIDGSTYAPDTDQDTVVDAGLYRNTALP